MCFVLHLPCAPPATWLEFWESVFKLKGSLQGLAQVIGSRHLDNEASGLMRVCLIEDLHPKNVPGLSKTGEVLGLRSDSRGLKHRGTSCWIPSQQYEWSKGGTSTQW